MLALVPKIFLQLAVCTSFKLKLGHSWKPQQYFNLTSGSLAKKSADDNVKGKHICICVMKGACRSRDTANTQVYTAKQRQQKAEVP